MKKYFSLLNAILVGLTALFLVACGGGDGNPGKVSTSTGTGTANGTGTTTSSTPKIAVSLSDANGGTLSTNSIGSDSVFYAKAVLTDSAGLGVSNRLVTFSTDTAVATVAQTTALTDTAGGARVQINPVNFTATKAATLTATATVDKVTVTSSLDFQTVAGNVSLTNMLAGQSSIGALQTTPVTVEGRINGSIATSGVVSVNFTAACGTFSPTSAVTNSAGLASTIYQSTVKCSGPITLTAQSTGATPATTSVTVVAAKAANVVYSSATAPLMVVSSTLGGIKQSILTFQVLDSGGAGMSGQALSVSLSGAAKDSGVKFLSAGVLSTDPQSVTTDSGGNASVTISSGSLPTPIVVTAALLSNPTIQASSVGISVTTGRATQRSASLSAEKLAIEAYAIDGVQTKLTMRVADRQGNPVPVGTSVNFVASHGVVTGSCNLDALSQCQVTYTSQGTRPTAVTSMRAGRAVVLAYLDGEMSFVDKNGDNIWQAGEPYEDVGGLYRDDNENFAYDPATEQIYPGGTTGSSPCPTPVNGERSVANTCVGTWSGSIRVRSQITISLSTSRAIVTRTTDRTISGFTVTVSDENGNSMPSGTTVTAAVLGTGFLCKVATPPVSPNVVPNRSDLSTHSINLDGSADCNTVPISVTVTTPGSIPTLANF